MIKIRFRDKIVGTFNKETKTFTKRVSRSKHFLWKYHAWGISVPVIKLLTSYGCETIEIIEKDKGEKLTCTLEEFTSYGITDDLGDGMQTFLKEVFFTKRAMSDRQPALPGVE